MTLVKIMLLQEGTEFNSSLFLLSETSPIPDYSKTLRIIGKECGLKLS